MDSSPPENLSSDREKLLQLLTEGHESAQQIRLTIGKLSGDDKSPVAIHDHVKKVLGSFAESMSILNRRPIEVGFERNPANLGRNSPLTNGRKFDDSEESSKSTSAFKERRRGCYKRRRTSPTRTIVTPNLIDDGHAWRKYGQKVILNAKHPRNYYRCTHKFDQGCQATKKVQITEEDPPMHRITYHGSHTCDQSLLKPPQIILDSTIPEEDNPNSVFLNFCSTSSQPTFPCVKQEYCCNMDELKLSFNHSQSAPMDDNLFLFPSDLTAAFNSSESNHGDVISSSEVYSCTASTHDDSHSFDLDMLVDVGDLDVSQFYAFDDDI